MAKKKENKFLFFILCYNRYDKKGRTMEKIILIKYGELTTKKANRNAFIKILNENILKVLKEYNVKIEKNRVRMYIESKEEDFEEIVQKLKSIFGLHSIVICYKVHNNIEEIEKAVLKKLKEEKGHTFKIITKRAEKTFPVHSMELNNKIASLILKKTALKVDVHNPEIPIHIEIRKEFTYIYTKEEKGIGGYPVGIQGKGMLMLSGGIDSPVAGYLALKRGIKIECMYFESPPHTSIEAKKKVLELAKIISKYGGNIKIHIVPFTKLQETIYKEVPHNYMITIMRRMMYRIAEKYAQKRNCKILINGESIGQVASQTLSSMRVINEVVKMPVIRPVACFDKLEIISLAEKIGTYKTSILPYEDCCTIFVPKHPVIHPSLEKAILYEKNFDYITLMKETIENIETIETENKSIYKTYL